MQEKMIKKSTTKSKNKQITEAILRKRGWSIHSSDHEASGQHDNDNGASNDNDNNTEEDDDMDEESSVDMETLFMAEEDEACASENPKKEEEEEAEFNRRKAQLSKWSLQFLDPVKAAQRKIIIESPQIIPLNDVYLKEFGKREREYDEKSGRTGDIDGMALSHGNSDDDDDEQQEQQLVPTKKRNGGGEGCKVKIVNLKYTTTADQIQKECSKFGRIVEVNLIMDKASDRSVGRAYVVFQSPEEASACAEGLHQTCSIDGRELRVHLAAALNTNARDAGANQSLLSQSWTKQQQQEQHEAPLLDISIKCRRCQRVGHMESICDYEELPKPCYICARIGEHDSRDCPMTCICFNCGIPGHASRNCREPHTRGGMGPRRVVCSVCFVSGHHRWQCKAVSDWEIRNKEAFCFVCKDKKHFSCKRIRWDESKYSMTLARHTCFNCGDTGHHGGNCLRPKVETCARNNQVTLAEIERAESWVDDIEKLRMHRSEARGRHPEKNDDRRSHSRQSSRERARSLPPPRESSRY